MATSEPASVFEMIHSWSLQRPSWQRDALRRIVVKGTLDRDDHFELVSLCKKGCGAPDVELTSVPLAEDHVPTAAAGTQTVVLTSIKDVSGVNRLAPDQELPFQPDGITVIYGDNGVGKSGYARILRRACRARFPGDILPNAFDLTARKAASATIGCLVAGAPLPSVAWTDGDSLHPVLSAVSASVSTAASQACNSAQQSRPAAVDTVAPSASWSIKVRADASSHTSRSWISAVASSSRSVTMPFKPSDRPRLSAQLMSDDIASALPR